MTPPQHVVAPRILFYAVDGLGLGHVTRMLAISNAVRVLRPQTQFLFLTTSEADNVIFNEGFPSVKLPSRSAMQKTGLRPRVFNKLTHSVVMNTISAFNPAVLVVDTFPAGASQELLPVLTWEMRRVFIFRTQQLARMNDSFFQTALGAYDLCVVPHAVGTESLTIPETVSNVWSGEIFIRSRSQALGRDEARELLGLPRDKKILYVSFGGGGDDEIKHAVAVTVAAAKHLGWTIAVADAPLQGRNLLPPRAANIIRVHHYPMAECFNAFDGAVSAGGYNTVAELLHFGVPSIVIPFPRGLDDQFARVERLATLGAILKGELNEDALRKQLTTLSDEAVAKRLSETAKNLVPENGASIAAQAILDLL